MALGAMRAIREAGLSVPHDIAIVGFDDLPGALQAEPPLTTIHQPVQQSGIEAVKILHAMLNDELEEPTHTFLPNTLIVRGSTRGSV
jgi:DNA-binding LacI/PurR family transcriptional regulator